MSARKFVLVTFLTLVFYTLSRFIGWMIFSQANWLKRMDSDNWHHWQLGLLLIFVAFFVFKRKQFIKDLFLAVGSGMVIDETMYALYPLDSSFSHYSPVGIIFEFLVFLAFSLIVLKIKPQKD